MLRGNPIAIEARWDELARERKFRKNQGPTTDADEVPYELMTNILRCMSANGQQKYKGISKKSRQRYVKEFQAWLDACHSKKKIDHVVSTRIKEAIKDEDCVRLGISSYFTDDVYESTPDESSNSSPANAGAAPWDNNNDGESKTMYLHIKNFAKRRNVVVPDPPIISAIFLFLLRSKSTRHIKRHPVPCSLYSRNC